MPNDPSITALWQAGLDDTQAGYSITPSSDVFWGTNFNSSRHFAGTSIVFNDSFASEIRDGTTIQVHTETLRLSIKDFYQWDRTSQAPISPDDLAFHDEQSFLNILGDFYDDGVVGDLELISRKYTRTNYRNQFFGKTTKLTSLQLTAGILLFSVSIDGQMQGLEALNEMSTVPVPAGAVLLLSGLGLLGFGARRKART
jgi:hypothetical protein